VIYITITVAIYGPAVGFTSMQFYASSA